MHAGAITSARGTFRLARLTSLEMEAETVHPSKEKAMGAIAVIQPAPSEVARPIPKTGSGRPNKRPHTPTTRSGTSLQRAAVFWNQPPSRAERLLTV